MGPVQLPRIKAQESIEHLVQDKVQALHVTPRGIGQRHGIEDMTNAIDKGAKGLWAVQTWA